jgi:hypothetical protein
VLTADDGSADPETGPAGNPDGDGRTNYEEAQAGTDPNNPDTGGDGFSDGAEADAGTDPKDSDSNPIEIRLATKFVSTSESNWTLGDGMLAQMQAFDVDGNPNSNIGSSSGNNVHIEDLPGRA